MTPAEASQRGRIGAHVRWSQEGDRVGATAPARSAFLDKLERQVDPDGKLTPAERARRAEHARQAHMARMAVASAAARKKKREAGKT